MFSHKNFALNGLFPGLVTHRSVANLGHFEIEVTIEPIPYTGISGGGGGGYRQPLGVDRTKYKIRIRITRKGKEWVYEQIVGLTIAKVAARIIKKTVAEPSISIVTKTVSENIEPTIKVTIK